MAVLPAVEDPLGRVPNGSGDDGVMVVWLEILVLLAVVFLSLVVLVIRRVGFPGQDVAAVLLVPHDGNDAAGSPVSIQRSVPAPPACGDGHLRQHIGDLLRSPAVDQGAVHPAHHPRLGLVDRQDLLFPAEAVRDLDFVIAEEPGRQETASGEPPFQGKEDGFALHMAFLLGDHGKDKKDDAAGLGHGIQIFLFEEDPDRRIMVLQGFDPADAVHEVTGETGYRFRDDHIDLAVHGVLHQLLEALTVVRVRSGESVIDIGPDIFPVGVRQYLSFVFPDLECDGDGLVDVIRGYPAIGCDPQDFVLIFRAFLDCSDLTDVLSIQGVQLLN